jgi:predicted TIM-barrel fold metal-dependent hydrolase
MAKPLVVDADGHVLEPPDLWQRYLEPKFRDRAMCIKFLDNGDEYLEVDGKMHFFGPGAMGGNGGAFHDPKELVYGKKKYWETAQTTPGEIDPDARVKQMDEEGIDIALLYPTIGLCWEGECQDPELSAAYCRAYNNYLFDFCSRHPDRLIPIAHVALRDVNLAAAEVQRVKGKAKGIFITPYPVNGCPQGDRYYDPFWAACEAAKLPVASHVQTRRFTPGSELRRSGAPSTVMQSWFDSGVWFMFMQLPMDSLLGLNCVFQGGVLERFPNLRYVVLETGCGWLPGWLERADGKYELFSFMTEMKRKPSETFRRNCWISTEVDEAATPYVAGLIGANRMVWASDYPHLDAHRDPVKELKEKIAPLSPKDQEWILGKAAIELYRL